MTDTKTTETARWTWYCGDHRDQIVRQMDGPQSLLRNGAYKPGPVCPICVEYMYWVPSQGSQVPQPTEGQST